MTREEAIKIIADYDVNGCGYCHQGGDEIPEAFNTAIEALKAEPCEDAVSRQAVLALAKDVVLEGGCKHRCIDATQIYELPSVTPKQRLCKDCKYFEYDSVAKVDGIPLIVAHEICNRWGDGCKTSKDGYCFLFEPKM